MHNLAIFFVFLVALEALYIMRIEMFGTPEKHAQTFDIPLEYTKQEQARTAMANQGLYNGFLGVGLLLSLFLLPSAGRFFVVTMFLVFISIAAIYGWLSSGKIKILYLQGSPAFIALLLWIFF
ncbi:DUF1304 domain-containing protein [Ligilactobacillus equi]|uniref:Integral membrane protein n=1 Tax=Ligilactobacillus equi DSM 15833 = JCM 10991 TaxID=1423740 RepID=A0A0R1TUN8_9LACO|nr:DUF1304 domain-containing protein [Ligilactobacillus equi]KRL84542.1 hypothetical protein FC36_GL000001 [Ligilactobacillus equi DSM 15833 = JCM 10991]